MHSRANGTKFGRPRKADDAEHITTAQHRQGFLGVSRAIVYRYLSDDAA